MTAWVERISSEFAPDATEKKERGKYMLFSDHIGALLRRQPRASGAAATATRSAS